MISMKFYFMITDLCVVVVTNNSAFSTSEVLWYNADCNGTVYENCSACENGTFSDNSKTCIS